MINQIKQILSSITRVDTDSIFLDSLLVDDLGVHSLNVMDLIVRCEELIGKELDDISRIVAIQTVQDLIDLCEE